MSVRLEFFEAAAQLVPVLLIAAAVDARGWASSTPHSHGRAVSELVGLTALTTAWLTSLLTVAFGQTHELLFVMVMLGLAVGWTEVASSIAAAHIERVRHARVTWRLRAWALASFLPPLGVVVVIAWL